MSELRDLDVALGRQIREHRVRSGLSLKELAAESDLSPSFLSQLERGLARPRITSLHRVARTLGTTAQALLSTEDPKNYSLVRRSDPRDVDHDIDKAAGVARSLVRDARSLSFEDIGQSDATVVYFAGGVFIDYMVDAGILRADQVDPSYNGAPARFVAEDGALVQQGFATSEPWLYENAIEEWGKPVDFLLVHDSGFEVYAQPLVVRQDALDELRPCLELVIPIFQQSVLDHYADSSPTDDLIIQIVDDLATFWVLYPGQMEYSAATALELGNVGNGPDDIVGNLDDARMERIVGLLKDVLVGAPQDIEASDIYTNEFIDPSIGF